MASLEKTAKMITEGRYTGEDHTPKVRKKEAEVLAQMGIIHEAMNKLHNATTPANSGKVYIKLTNFLKKLREAEKTLK